MANDPQRPIRDDPGQRGMPAQRGSARGTATVSRDYEARERAAPPPREYRPPRRRLPLAIAGIIGLVLLGGLIAGLVVSHTPSTPAPTAHTLSSFGTHGSAVSPSFTVPSSPVTSTYGYRCPAGTGGRFTASLVNSNGSDSHSIVNTTATNVSGTATLHPAHIGSPYHVAVTAPAGCAYRINTAAP